MKQEEAANGSENSKCEQEGAANVVRGQRCEQEGSNDVNKKGAAL
jgi:hypothetical protein